MQVRQNLDGGVTHNLKPGWAWDVTWMELRCYFLDQERCNTSPGWMWNVWKAIWVFIQHFPISGIISRYREINFRYREIINFPISGNDSRYRQLIFRYWEICLISRYREIDSGYIRKSSPQKQVTPAPVTPPYHTGPLSTTATSHTGTSCTGFRFWFQIHSRFLWNTQNMFIHLIHVTPKRFSITFEHYLLYISYFMSSRQVFSMELINGNYVCTALGWNDLSRGETTVASSWWWTLDPE